MAISIECDAPRARKAQRLGLNLVKARGFAPAESSVRRLRAGTLIFDSCVVGHLSCVNRVLAFTRLNEADVFYVHHVNLILSAYYYEYESDFPYLT